MSQKKTLVSLYSGALGLDIGLENAGFDLRALVECDRVAIQTAKVNLARLGKSALVLGEKIDTENIGAVCHAILKGTKLKQGQIDLLAGAPPCQPFSTAGKRKSIQDDRGDGFTVFLKAVRLLRPKYFVIENVKGILSAARSHRPLAERGPGFPPLSPDEEQGSAFIEILDKIQELCSDMGYCASWGIINSADCGSPQSRERLIIIGSIRGQFIWPQLTHSKQGDADKQKWMTLYDALYDLHDDDPLYREFSKDVVKYLKRVPEGGNWRDLPRSQQKQALGGAFNSWGGRSGFLRRLSWLKPAPTITRSPSAKATMLCHPEETRPLTVRECARLQQFPDDWAFTGGMAEQYKQIGNATPVALAEVVGTAILEAANRRKKNNKGQLYCADAKLLERMINRPKTTLNPIEMRKDKDPMRAKKWLKDSQKGRDMFSKFLAYSK